MDGASALAAVSFPLPAPPLEVRFFAAGLPKGQPRPRAFARKGLGARVYDPGTAEGWKSCVAQAAAGLFPSPAEGPLQLTVEFLFPRPKAHFTKKGLREGAAVWHTAKPDSDNAAKAVMDAMTVLGAWKDDAQVAVLISTKRYANGDERPGAWITVRVL